MPETPKPSDFRFDRGALRTRFVEEARARNTGGIPRREVIVVGKIGNREMLHLGTFDQLAYWLQFRRSGPYATIDDALDYKFRMRGFPPEIMITKGRGTYDHIRDSFVEEDRRQILLAPHVVYPATGGPVNIPEKAETALWVPLDRLDERKWRIFDGRNPQ